MKILFSMRHYGALRNYESTLRELAKRGHRIHLAFVLQDKHADDQLLMRLLRDCPGMSFTRPAKRVTWTWLGLARVIRYIVDFLRFLEPAYDSAPKLRERAADRVPAVVRGLFALAPFRRPGALRWAHACLAGLERAIPPDPDIQELLASQKPDVVLVTPLVDLGSDQIDSVKGARALGLRTGLCVHSWDNLTNKGLIQVIPDRVFVWNEEQKREAVEMHGVPPASVVVTGAAAYDHWFEWKPRTSREEFCRKVGLPPERPFVLYVGSSPFIAPNEAEFIAKWGRAVRASEDGRLREAGILIRPHPENVQPWHRVDLSGLGSVAVWPRGGANPTDVQSKADYYDSLFHSSAVVGVNTSALIEAGIVGRSVYTVLAPEFAGTQEGTLHFHYLLSVNGGLLSMARDFPEHVTQLAAALDAGEGARERVRRFVHAFVRPHGLATPATPLLVEAIESLGRIPAPSPQKPPVWAYPLRLGLYPLALLVKVAWQASRRRLSPSPRTVLGWMLRLSRFSSFLNRHAGPAVSVSEQGFKEMTTTQHLLRRAARRAAKSEVPIVIGPWLSEVGFEVLYWIPFLNWAKSHCHLSEDRLVVVSRGGAGLWYRNITANYIDVLSYFSPEEFVKLNEGRIGTDGIQKQRAVTALEREIVRLVKQSLTVRQVELLHPSAMYKPFFAFWKEQLAMRFIELFTVYQPLPPVDASDLAPHLPEEYVAVRFYFNNSFPDTEENRARITSVLGALTETTDVVLLNTGYRLDDHRDFGLERMERVHTIEHLMAPRTNLEVQSKVISRARAFVGTYGGLSYVAPFYGIDAVALYSHPDEFNRYHLELAGRVFDSLKLGSLVALNVRDLDLVRLAIGDGKASRRV